MKLNFKVIAVLLLGVLFYACQEESVLENAMQEGSIENTQADLKYHNFPWEIVMDWRFSRGTCTTGPGICFRDGYGDIYTFYSIADNGSNEEAKDLQNKFEILLKGNTDMDNGAIAFKKERNGLRIVFSRSLEEEYFVVPYNYNLNEKLSAKLGRRSIVIPAGEYRIDRSRFKNGETVVPIK